MDMRLIERLASEAGWRVDSYTNSKERRLLSLTPSSVEQVERFAALVAAHEREQCAVVCDVMGNPWRGSEDCAAAIRARGELSRFIPD